MDYSQLDSKRIALVFHVRDTKIVIRGICRWIDDELMGRTLQVIDPAEPAGESKFLFQMKLVQSALEPGAAYDCDYCLPLDGPSAEGIRNQPCAKSHLRDGLAASGETPSRNVYGGCAGASD